MNNNRNGQGGAMAETFEQRRTERMIEFRALAQQIADENDWTLEQAMASLTHEMLDDYIEARMEEERTLTGLWKKRRGA